MVNAFPLEEKEKVCDVALRVQVEVRVVDGSTKRSPLMQECT